VKTELLQSIAQVRLRQANYDRLQTIGEGAIALRQQREAYTALQEAKIRAHSAQQTAQSDSHLIPTDQRLSKMRAVDQEMQKLGGGD